MNIDLKNNKKNKYILYAVCIPITIWLFYSSLGDLFGAGDDVNVVQPTASNPAVSTASGPQNNNVNVNPAKQGNPNTLAKDASASILFGEDSSNPFVEIGELVVDMANPQQPVMTARSPQYSGGLPAIPRPNLPSIPTPNPNGFNVPGGSVPSPTVVEPEVQGILSSGDGSAMAMMSDGTILSEGDTYRDGRIAWIGGEGIHFDDGSSMLYR